jgi:hypothetical protein
MGFCIWSHSPVYALPSVSTVVTDPVYDAGVPEPYNPFAHDHWFADENVKFLSNAL